MEELGGEGREGKKGGGRGGGAIQCLASGRHRRSCATVFTVKNQACLKLLDAISSQLTSVECQDSTHKHCSPSLK